MMLVNDFDYYIFIDADDSNKVKALNGKTHGIDSSHASDFGTVFNACVTAAAGTRVKISLQPSAAFTTTTTCTIKTNVMIDGNYAEVKLANGTNVDIFKTENFATLTGTNAFSTNVPHDFTIRYLRIDGNKANNTSACYGLRIVAWGYDLDHVFIYNCKNDGFYSEWGTTTGCPLTSDLTKRCMEAYLSEIYIHDCGGRGMTWRGPHDSVMNNIFSWGNDSFCASFETLAATYSGGCTVSNYHGWGGTTNTAAYTVIDNTSVSMSNFISEGADGVGGIGIDVKAGSKLWGNCTVFANETGIKFEVTANYSDLRIDSFGNTVGVELLGNQNRLTGYLHDNTLGASGQTDIKIGSAGVAVSYSMLDLKMTRTPLAISWLNASSSDNFIVAQIETSAGHVALTGSPNHVTNDLVISSKGAGTNYITGTPVTTGAVQTFATGAKTFNSSLLKLRNPADTFSYTVVPSAIAADRNLTIPLLTADDTVSVLGLAQSPTNKTFDSTNTISSATSLPTVTVAKGGTGATTAAAGFDALSAMTTLGDTQYGGASGTRTRLAGNITTAQQYLSQTGDGTNSAAPAWRTPRSLVIYNWSINTSTNSNFFLLLFTGVGQTTESLMDIVTDYDLLVKRLRVTVSTNSKAGTCTASFRDDGADVTGATVSITTGVAGEYDSGAISVLVAAGSKICGRVDASAGVSGTLTLTAIVEAEVLLQ